ncbi:helix-turn-helix domain-containing protein [Microbacterium halotolerans]|uniref:helix-turn-helix domain-containing protein n=1 Tax=Microbacterium halotolerans TaxID=246613 RepID=UPI000E6AB68E|nr:helix-turn-helix transcriptional regulator [Microbacterium halotolerans]
MDTPADVFARRLRHEREVKRISQSELARRLSDRTGTGVSATAITKIESGDRSVRIDEAVYLAEILDVPLSALLSDRGPDEIRMSELRRQIEQQRSLANTAEHEWSQANAAWARLHMELEELEASFDDD